MASKKQKFEGPGPVFWYSDRTMGGLFESDGKCLQPPSVGHIGAWRKSDEFKVGAVRAPGEFADLSCTGVEMQYCILTPVDQLVKRAA